jgi:hypothetical protein
VLRKKKKVPTCPAGHPQEESWERCPFCEAEKHESRSVRIVGSAARDQATDPGDGAVVVQRTASPVRPLAGWLVALGGEQAGRDFRVEVGRNSIGKGAECNVVVKDPQVSEKHAILEIGEDRHVTLRDLDSKYGTFVDENRVHGERPIHDGDHIRVGATELRYRSYE